MHLPQILDFTSTIKGKLLYKNHLYIHEFKFRLTKDVLKGKSFGDTIKPYLISYACACVNMRATHNF